MNMSLLGVLLVCVLGVCTSVTAVLAYAGVGRDARCRRRRARLRLVVGAGAPSRTDQIRPPRARREDDGARETDSWDPLPVPQWAPPRAHEAKPSPAA